MAPLNKYSIDFTRFIALGDSVTAGYKDAALFYEGQIHSYPMLMTEQFKLKNNLIFKQPLISRNSVGIGFFGNSRLVLQRFTDQANYRLSYLSPNGDTEALKKNIYSAHGPFNNLGVPGAKATTLLAPGYGDQNKGAGNYNPFFSRMSSDPEKASVLSDAMMLNPTFFSLFIGNNDVMAYALSGGTTDEITPIAGPPGTGFESSINFIVNTLTLNKAKGVVSNLPRISAIPFFNTIHHNGLLLDANTADLLTARYQACGFNFRAGHNSFLIEDPLSMNGIRQIEKDEFILLDVLLDEDKFNYMKGLNPIPKKYYLSKFQIDQIQTALTSYNTIIKNIAYEKKLAFVDTDLLLGRMKADRVYNENTLSVKYKTGGVFSLDGLHINPLGQALLANEFIKSINQNYGTHIIKGNITKFRGKLLN